MLSGNKGMSLRGIWLVLLRRRKTAGDTGRAAEGARVRIMHRASDAGQFAESAHVRVVPVADPGRLGEQAKVGLRQQDSSRMPGGPPWRS